MAEGALPSLSAVAPFSEFDPVINEPSSRRGERGTQAAMGKERARCRRPSDFDDDKIRRWERAFSSHRRQLKAARKFCAPKTARCGGDDVVYRLLRITLNPVYYPIDSQRGCLVARLFGLCHSNKRFMHSERSRSDFVLVLGLSRIVPAPQPIQ